MRKIDGEEKVLNDFSGYLESVGIRFKEAVPDHQIPAQFEYQFILSAIDEHDDNKKKDFVVQLSHRNNCYIPYLLNFIAAQTANPDWDRFMHFSVYSSNGFPRIKINNDGENASSPGLLDWDKERGTLQFVPKPKILEITDQDGNPVKDYRAVWSWWLTFFSEAIYPYFYRTLFDFSSITKDLDPNNTKHQQLLLIVKKAQSIELPTQILNTIVLGKDPIDEQPKEDESKQEENELQDDQLDDLPF